MIYFPVSRECSWLIFQAFSIDFPPSTLKTKPSFLQQALIRGHPFPIYCLPKINISLRRWGQYWLFTLLLGKWILFTSKSRSRHAYLFITAYSLFYLEFIHALQLHLLNLLFINNLCIRLLYYGFSFLFLFFCPKLIVSLGVHLLPFINDFLFKEFCLQSGLLFLYSWCPWAYLEVPRLSSWSQGVPLPCWGFAFFQQVSSSPYSPSSWEWMAGVTHILYISCLKIFLFCSDM